MRSAAALHRLKEARRASREQSSTPSSSHAAAVSDADNEAYLHLNAAFQRLSTSHGQLTDRAQAGCSHHQQQQQQQQQHAKRSQRPAALPSRVSSSSSIPAARLPEPGLLEPAVNRTIAPGWRAGPVDAAGVLVQLSERPILCSAAAADGSGDVVVGSSDHALYVVDVAAGRKKRTLFSKSAGHTEWVTTVCCLPCGHILSGGMDGRLWLWPAAGAAGTEVRSAHEAPVSKVAALHPTTASEAQAQAAGASYGRLARSSSSSGGGGGGVRAGLSSARAAAQAAAGGPVLAASCSYDKTVKLWDVSGRAGKQLACMCGHAGPVLELAVAPEGSALLTGDRKGSLMCWDVSTASSGWDVKEAHAGHVTALAWQQPAAGSSSMLALSGGRDGCLRVWDGRSGGRVAHQALHVDAHGKGAIGGIVTVNSSGQQLVVTAGADQTLKVVDPAASYRPLHTVQLTDFPYSLAAVGGGLVACGCGDGSVHVVDAVRGSTLYALGAGQAAVRALEVGRDRLVCSGDDGCVVCYEFR